MIEKRIDANFEVYRIYEGDEFRGIIHCKNFKWYLTLSKKKVFNTTFRTCSNGIVRYPAMRSNQCSDAMTWNTKEEILQFLEKICIAEEERNLLCGG